MKDTNGFTKLADRKETKAGKRDAKKREIADSAISVLKHYGYARTTLRDIAAQSGMSLGSLHYYFEDKNDLLIFCVRRYKLHFVEMIKKAVEGAIGAEGAINAMCKALADTIHAEAELHRLWYDIRTQAMFDPTFVEVVTEIEVMLIGMFAPLAPTPEAQRLLYLRFDGAFRYFLQAHLAGQKMEIGALQQAFSAASGIGQSIP